MIILLGISSCIFVISVCFTLQAREKFLSLRKGTKGEVATVLEEVFTHIKLK